MATIQFENKVALIENADIPDINKVKADDMNEIKEVVNENSINVGVEEPTDETVWVEYSKNLFNSSIQQGNITSTGYDTTSTTRICTNSFIKVEPGGIYTLSFTGTDISYYDACYFTTNSFPRNSESGWVSNGSSFTVPNDCEYIQFSFRKTASSTITPSEISNIMLNPGSTALDYEEYTQSTININNNGVYEKLTDTLNVGTEENGKCRVNVLKSRNLFDNRQIPIKKVFGSGTLNYTQTSTGVSVSYTTSETAAIIYKVIDVSNYVGQKITIKANYDDNSNGYYNIGLCDANGENRIIAATSTSSGEVLTYTIPTLTTSKYLALWFYCNKNGTVNYTNIMVNFGDTALDYEPYVVPSINVDGEEIYSKEKCKFFVNSYLDSDQTISGSNYANINTINSKQITTYGGDLLITATLFARLTQDYTGTIKVFIDDVEITNRIMTIKGTSVLGHTGQIIVSGITAGNHTLDIRGKADSTAYDLIIASPYTTSLSVIEL